MKPERKGGYGWVLEVYTTSIGGKAINIQYLDEDQPVTVLIGPSLVERVDFDFDSLENCAVFLEYDQIIGGKTEYVDRDGNVQVHKQSFKNAVVTSRLFKPLEDGDPMKVRLEIKLELTRMKTDADVTHIDEKLTKEIEEMKALAKNNPVMLSRLNQMLSTLNKSRVMIVEQAQDVIF
jgi:hypothetical protein